MEQQLRAVLRINAATSALGGLAAAVAPDTLDRLLDTGQPTAVRVVGAGLVSFAAWVFVVARWPAHRLRHEAVSISAGDAAWVVASVVTIALGWYSPGGAIVVAAVAAMVGSFAYRQARLVRRMVDARDHSTVTSAEPERPKTSGA